MTQTRKESRIQETKNKLSSQLDKYPFIGVVGRVSDWLKDSKYRYPISCTMLRVKDTMEGDEGIEYSWAYASKGLRYGAGVVLDLSELRCATSPVGNGGFSAGAPGFAQIYSMQNQILRRGGVYKNGAIVVNLNVSHGDCEEFLNLSPTDVPWIKRTLYVSDDPTDSDYLMNSPYLDKIIAGVANGTLWLSKKQWDKEGNRIYSNVCNGILIPSRGSCLLTHVNLGQCSIKNLRLAFKVTMKFLCTLHGVTGAGKDNYYLPPNLDKQVGLGVFGLSNFLAKYKITYKEFTDALENFLDAKLGEEESLIDFNARPAKVRKIVIELSNAFDDAAIIARKYGMDRAFTVEPTASCSFRYKDTKGYTTTPEISPPICHPETKVLVRDSVTFGQVEYQYPSNVETAQEVGWDTYYRLCQNWQRLMNTTGLAHSISFNIWNTCPITKDFLEDWLKSELITTYYRMMVEQSYLDKSTITSTISSEFKSDLIGKSDFFKPVEEEETESNFCFLTPDNDPNFCAACAE
jgi:hypothetical protein